MDDITVERDYYRNALKLIWKNEGLVCSEFEICKHKSCMSSYTSWAIADEALNKRRIK